MFRWFENRLDPFPAAELSEPPRKLLPFCMHFTRGAWPYIILAAILTAGIAVTEVWLFAFLGNIVDWLSGQSRETFLQTEGWKLIGMALIAIRRSWAITPCASAGWYTVTCSNNQWPSIRTSSPDASPPN